MTGVTALPATMRAMAVSAFGSPEAIQPCVLPVPSPGPGELLVRVAAVGVNPADWKACTGWLPFLSDQSPLVPGFDGTGMVAALGEGVTGFALGDRIAFMSSVALGRGGSWADYAVCRADHAVCLPDTLSFADAAAIPVPGISSREALLTRGGVTAGERVLVNGGAGGTGIFAVQLAREAGARVAATAGPANQELLRQLGVECPIDYRGEDVAARLRDWAPDGVDLLLDTVGQGSLPDPAALIRPGGRYVAIETMIPDERLPDPDGFAAKGISALRASADFARLGTHLAALVAGVAQGTIRVPPLTAMPAAMAGEAMARVRDGTARRKLVLTLDDETDRAIPAREKIEDYA